MVLLRSSATAALAALLLLGSTLAVPLVHKLKGLSPGARDLLKRSIPAAPRFVVYDDTSTSTLPTPTQLQGYNVYALSFWTTSGVINAALLWQGLADTERTSYLQEYNAAGISLIVSAFGPTDSPTTLKTNPVTIANSLAAWVLQYGLQGVDVDYQDSTAFDNGLGTAEPWLISLTQQLRTQLLQGDYILTHAPLAPWFSPTLWTGGGYLQVDKSVGSMIDWYNVEFYNEGSTEYTTCSGLLTASSSTWLQTALFQIVASGVSVDKLVIGKPATAADALGGYMATATLASCVSQAYAAGWDAGVSVWEYPDATSAWIAAVRGSTF